MKQLMARQRNRCASAMLRSPFATRNPIVWPGGTGKSTRLTAMGEERIDRYCSGRVDFRHEFVSVNPTDLLLQ